MPPTNQETRHGPHRTTIWVVDPTPSPVSLRQSYFSKLARNAVSVGTIRVTIRLLWGCYKITMGTVRILRALHSHKITCHAFDGSWWHEKASSFVTYMCVYSILHKHIHMHTDKHTHTHTDTNTATYTNSCTYA